MFSCDSQEWKLDSLRSQITVSQLFCPSILKLGIDKIEMKYSHSQHFSLRRSFGEQAKTFRQNSAEGHK